MVMLDVFIMICFKTIFIMEFNIIDEEASFSTHARVKLALQVDAVQV